MKRGYGTGGPLGPKSNFTSVCGTRCISSSGWIMSPGRDRWVSAGNIEPNLSHVTLDDEGGRLAGR